MDSQVRGFSVGMVIGLVLAACIIAATIRQGDDSSAIDLPNRLNPNAATVSSLTRLPGIGPARASAIVAYRTQMEAETGHEKVFNRPEDLQRVRGIGPVTAGEIAAWLDFGISEQ